MYQPFECLSMMPDLKPRFYNDNKNNNYYPSVEIKLSIGYKTPVTIYTLCSNTTSG